MASKKYSNPKLEFSICYPFSWFKNETHADEGIVVLFCDKKPDLSNNNQEQPATLNVTLVPWPGTLQEFTKNSVDEIKERIPVENMRLGPTAISGEIGCSAQYTSQLDQTMIMKVMQSWALYHGKAYVITYSALSENFDQKLADHYIGSFKFVEQKYKLIDLMALTRNTNEDLGFQIWLPRSWSSLKPIPNSQTSAYVAESGYYDSDSSQSPTYHLLLVVDGPLSSWSSDPNSPINLQLYSRIHQRLLSEQLCLSEPKLPKLSEAWLSRKQGKKVEYIDPQNGKKTTRIFTIHRGYAYVLTFQSNRTKDRYDLTDLCLFPRIAKSFSFLNTPSSIQGVRAPPKKKKDTFRFEDLCKGFSIQYGEPYEYNPGSAGIVVNFVKKDPYCTEDSIMQGEAIPCNLLISVADIQPGDTLEQFAEEMRKQDVSLLQDWNINDQKTGILTVDFDAAPHQTEIEALIVINMGQIQTPAGPFLSVKCYQKFAIKGDKGYVIAFFSTADKFDSEMKETVQEMIDSFQLFDPLVIPED